MKNNSILEKLIEEYRSIILSKHHLEKLKDRLQLERNRLQELEAILDQKYNNLYQLEKLSLRALFYTMLQTKDEQFEIESQEYLHAVLQLKDCKKTIELLEFERKVLLSKVNKEKRVQDQLNHLFTEREEFISSKYASLKNQLIIANQKLDQELGYKREIYEALIVGLKARDVFTQMIALLVKAKDDVNWGAELPNKEELRHAKNSYLDQAQELSYKAKQLLQELMDEMEDIYMHKSIRRLNKFEEFKHFNDIYYDRLISDWMVQNRIVSTLNYLKGTMDSLKRIVETLKIQKKTTEKNIEYLNKRKDELILESIEQ